MLIMGLDISLNHFACVFRRFPDGPINTTFSWHVKSKVATWQKHFKATDFNILFRDSAPSKNVDATSLQTRIDKAIQSYIDLVELIESNVNYKESVIINIEDYAYGKSIFQLLGLIEFTGYVKSQLYNAGYCLRTTDPLSVKLWAGSGNYDKTQMIKAAQKVIDIPDEFCVPKTANAGADVADAYFLMDMLYTEIMVRRDPMELKKLGEKKIQVFNRVTKNRPINLLSQPFVAKKQPVLKTTVRKVVSKDAR